MGMNHLNWTQTIVVAAVALLIWLGYAVWLFHLRRKSFRLSAALLPLLLFNVILCVNFGLDYSQLVHNGGARVSLLSQIVLSHDNALLQELLLSACRVTTSISLLLLVLSMALHLFETIREGKKEPRRN